jgi:hypothetical protein
MDPGHSGGLEAGLQAASEHILLASILPDPSLVVHMNFSAGSNRVSTMRGLLAMWMLPDCAWEGIF